MLKKNMKRREGQTEGKLRKDRGMVLIIAILLMSGLIFVASTFSIRSTGQTQVTSVELDNTKTFYAAEAAIEWGTAELRDLLNANLDPSEGEIDGLPEPNLDGYELSNYGIEETGSLTEEMITSGDYTGLYGYVQRYNITAAISSERRTTELVREIQHQYIPLFQFGVFYDKDLEIYPGPSMTFEGRIHTNANLYMGGNTGITCNSYITAVGHYYHNRKDDGTDPTGFVRVKDRLGVLQDVWRGTYWLDARQATWAADAITLWGGQFKDGSHSLATLRLPLPPASDQHIIIERGVIGDGSTERDAKYWYKASIKYVDGVLTDSSGTVIVQPGVYTYTANKFKDTRQNKWMDVVDINIATMVAGGYMPPNGIIYISHNSGDAPCVRIINGSTLPNNGLTIATDLPMYVKGNYNTVTKRGSALLSDALTLLSPAWNDANSSLALGSRIPTSQTVNACVMTGHVGTVGAAYSGGLENNFRFLEKWSGKTVTYRGSIIDLWYSTKAAAPWSYGVYYEAPNRNWGFDTDLLSPSNWPPGTPRVHTIQRGTWRQIS